MVRRKGSDIFFFCDVDGDSVADLACLLREAEAAAKFRKKEGPIRLFLASEGGDPSSGLAAANIIRTSECDIWTVAVVEVASAATYMLVVGDHRQMHKYATVLIHEISLSGIEGRHSQTKALVLANEGLQSATRDLYADHTRISRPKLKAILATESAFRAAQCKKLGIIDEIIG